MSTTAMDITGAAPVQALKPPPEASAASAENEKKRPADESATPTMSKAAASKTLSALKAPKQKNQSQYVRFKALLLKEAKDRGDTDMSSNITKVAKDAWAKVKHLTPPPPIDPATNTNDASSVSASVASNLGEDVQRYLRLKGRAIKDEHADKLKFDAELKKYCIAFAPAATSLLQWHTIEATSDNFAALQEQLALVATKHKSVPWPSSVDQVPLVMAMKEAMDQLKAFREMNSESALITKLRNATDEELAAHVKEHRRLLSQVAELNVIKQKKEAQEKRQRLAEEQELMRAWRIPNEITSALSKQMKYTNSNLKYSSVRISYTRGGVTPKVFAKAFNVPLGMKKATIAGREVGTKSLRYGAYLECDTVNVKLVGEELVANTSYFMSK